MFGTHHGQSHSLARRSLAWLIGLCTFCASCVLFAPAYLVAAEDAGGDTVVKADVAEPAVPPEAAPVAGRIEVAALPRVPELLASLALASAPSTEAEDAARRFVQVEGMREEGQGVNAVLAYISLIDRYPGSPQAGAADSRANYVMNQFDGAQWAALEASLPAPDSPKNLDSLIVLGQAHALLARRLSETDPARAAQHIQTVYEMAWRTFEEDLDDHYKTTILEEYLLAADALGKGEETRKALSAHAETLPWSFTRWLIGAELDGVEADPKQIPTQEGLEAVRKYYLLKGRDSSDPAKAVACFTKSRDIALGLLNEQAPDVPRFDLAHTYLEAADAVGAESAAEAVSVVEKYLESQPVSIMRWIVRYELAVYLTRGGASAEQMVAGFRHFEAMVAEGEKGFVEEAIRNTGIDVEVRGLLACVWGHAYAGTNRVDDAKLFYDWVLEYCPRETHPGESAAYAKAVAFERQHTGDPAACTASYEEFVREHPSSFYAPHALISVAETREKQGDSAGAIAVYERVEREYTNRSETQRAQTQRDALLLKGGAQE